MPSWPADLLAGAAWECAPGRPDRAGPDGIADLEWIPAVVPGTAAAALRDLGADFERDFDAEEWWYRVRFAGPARDEPRRLELDGLATMADVWLNGVHLLRSENMFLSHRLALPELEPENELVIRFSALTSLRGIRRPRPRWKTALVPDQGLRWHRTTLLGRIPGWAGHGAPVGPYRPVRAVRDGPRTAGRRLTGRWRADGATLDLDVTVVGSTPPGTGPEAVVRVAGSALAGRVSRAGDRLRVVASGPVPGARPWWPHTHGAPALYPVVLALGSWEIELGRIGFRQVEVDRSDGGFRLLLNGTEIFCRGACWLPTDVISLVGSPDGLADLLGLVREANMNMVRIPGTTVYEDEAFWDLCDQLGIMVWQDCMFANLDPPEDEAWLSSVADELRGVFAGLSGRPSLTVVCGGSEIEQQAAMLGLSPDHSGLPLFSETIPALVDELLPDVAYVANSPTGGFPAFRPDTGVAHYFGVGAYRRGLGDVRRSRVRFASECLAFSVPPEEETVEEMPGGSASGMRQPGWRAAVPRDSGVAWDFEDVRDSYVGRLFGTEPAALRFADPPRALNLGRAAVAEVDAAVLSEWRRPGSGCSGALVLSLRDLYLGAGWGLIDVRGRPKAPWYTLRRVLAPVTVLASDEGLNGLALHIINDREDELRGRLDLQLWAEGVRPVEDGGTDVTVPGRSSLSLDAAVLIGAFRDVNYAYQFGPPAYDVAAATLSDASGERIARYVHLPLGPARPVESDLGLTARLEENGGRLRVTVATRRFAQFVVVQAPGLRPSDSWFHLVPGDEQPVDLLGPEVDRPRVTVSALNARHAVTAALP